MTCIHINMSMYIIVCACILCIYIYCTHLCYPKVIKVITSNNFGFHSGFPGRSPYSRTRLTPGTHSQHR